MRIRDLVICDNTRTAQECDISVLSERGKNALIEFDLGYSISIRSARLYPAVYISYMALSVSVTGSIDR